MQNKLTLLTIAVPLVLALSSSARAAPDAGPFFEALFKVENDAFTPPDKNAALQALLAKRPVLTFLETCAVGDTAEMTRQLKRDPKLATTWTKFGWSALHLPPFSGVPGAVQMLNRGVLRRARRGPDADRSRRRRP